MMGGLELVSHTAVKLHKTLIKLGYKILCKQHLLFQYVVHIKTQFYYQNIIL